jgi:sugar phosphate isomerase/epimerase
MVVLKLGCAVGQLRDGPAAGKLRSLKPLGIQYIEPQFGTDAKDAEDEPFVEKVRQELEGSGVRVWSVHAPFGPEVDLSSPNEGVRERGIAAAIRAACGCHDLGGKVIVVHCGDEFDEEDRPARAKAHERSVEPLKRIADRCASLGVRLALENLPPGYLTSSTEELLSVLERFPPQQMGVCLDTGHAHIAGNLVGLVRAVAARIITTHIHDNDRSGDQHYVPGSGTINWRTASGELARSPYFAADGGGPLMFEVSGPGSHADAIMRLADAGSLIERFMAR